MTIQMPRSQHSGSVRATFRMADGENDNKYLVLNIRRHDFSKGM